MGVLFEETIGWLYLIPELSTQRKGKYLYFTFRYTPSKDINTKYHFDRTIAHAHARETEIFLIDFFERKTGRAKTLGRSKKR